MLQVRIRDPALRDERLRIRENRLVVVDERARHADGGAGWYGPFPTAARVGEEERFVRADALETGGDAIA